MTVELPNNRRRKTCQESHQKKETGAWLLTEIDYIGYNPVSASVLQQSITKLLICRTQHYGLPFLYHK